KNMNAWDAYKAPTDNFVEEVFLAEAAADEEGSSTILLQNHNASRGASITWDAGPLPYVTVWKYTAAEADGYVTGLEPGTGFPFNRFVERHFGRVPKLGPGDSVEFKLTYAVHPDEQSVSDARQRIQAIQRRGAAVITPTAPAVPALGVGSN
ncbi:MAG: DUF4432 family protein, partial [Myxococcales bacterium]|nr:DUF4432 family protein [Myxococcales bacterium]